MFTNALLTDLYELTMGAGYLEQANADDTTTFDLYFRRNPFRGGYAVAAGLEDAIHSVMSLRFSSEDVAFLRLLRGASGSRLFSEAFLQCLSEFRFQWHIR